MSHAERDTLADIAGWVAERLGTACYQEADDLPAGVSWESAGPILTVVLESGTRLTGTFAFTEKSVGPPDVWTIYASSGEYSEAADDASAALAQFIAKHPDDYVSAVVNDLMQPRLVLEEPS